MTKENDQTVSTTAVGKRFYLSFLYIVIFLIVSQILAWNMAENAISANRAGCETLIGVAQILGQAHAGDTLNSQVINSCKVAASGQGMFLHFVMGGIAFIVWIMFGVLPGLFIGTSKSSKKKVTVSDSSQS